MCADYFFSQYLPLLCIGVIHLRTLRYNIKHAKRARPQLTDRNGESNDIAQRHITVDVSYVEKDGESEADRGTTVTEREVLLPARPTLQFSMDMATQGSVLNR